MVSGMGKSGHIGNKIAATFASTGTPAFFMHPGEANHGDLGMLGANDVLVAISNSGETGELLNLLPVVKRMNVPVIAMTNRPDSTLGKHADVVLDIGVEQEACTLGLAPTTSTTVTLVMGDALAIAILEARGFTAEEFAFSHPGGALGKRLLLRVADVMVSGSDIPTVAPTAALADAIVEMTEKGLGMTTIASDDRQLLGIFTDGDLRRAVKNGTDLRATPLTEAMTADARTIHQELLAAEAMALMERHQISALVVVDDQNTIIGIVTLLALLKAGLS